MRMYGVVMSDRARQLVLGNGLSILPRHTRLKNQIGFSDQIFDHYHNSGFLHGLKNRTALPVPRHGLRRPGTACSRALPVSVFGGVWNTQLDERTHASS